MKFSLDAYEPTKDALDDFKVREEDGDEVTIKEKVTTIAKIVWKPVIAGTEAIYTGISFILSCFPPLVKE